MITAALLGGADELASSPPDLEVDLLAVK